MERKEYDASQIILNGIYGAIIGDAMGVPVEFSSRDERDKDPVTGFREFGTHDQPKGTWSDDTSMMLATMSSIVRSGGIDYEDIMRSFSEWLYAGKYTPFGVVFDAGITCENAIKRYVKNNTDPLLCGGRDEYDNGNGSLMRILPVSLIYAAISNRYAWGVRKKADYWDEELINKTVSVIHNVSALTHGHPRSKIACVLYTSICHELIINKRVLRNEQRTIDTIQTAVDKTFRYYTETAEKNDWFDDEFRAELKKDVFGRLKDIKAFKDLPRDEIKSSGYVVDTLEAAIWCLLNSSGYEECVLKAINLGGDTDTVGAVTGGLAGLIAHEMYFWLDLHKNLVKHNEIHAALKQYEELFFEPYMEKNNNLYWDYQVAYDGDEYNPEDRMILGEIKDKFSIKEMIYTEKNHPGRDKCDMLRKLRIKIAKANNIDLVVNECHNTNPCLGTCPACDSELKYLESELMKKASRGEKISVSGLTDEELENWSRLWGMDLWDTVTKLDSPLDFDDVLEKEFNEIYDDE